MKYHNISINRFPPTPLVFIEFKSYKFCIEMCVTPFLKRLAVSSNGTCLEKHRKLFRSWGTNSTNMFFFFLTCENFRFIWSHLLCRLKSQEWEKVGKTTSESSRHRVRLQAGCPRPAGEEQNSKATSLPLHQHHILSRLLPAPGHMKNRHSSLHETEFFFS